jgi:hypothetical protein
MEELGQLPVCEPMEPKSAVLLAFDKDDDDDANAPMVPVCAAVAFL